MGDDGKPHITKETLVTVERHPHIHKHPKEIPDEHKDDVIEELQKRINSLTDKLSKYEEDEEAKDFLNKEILRQKKEKEGDSQGEE